MQSSPTQITKGKASVTLTRTEGGLYAHGLEGSGNPSDLLQIIRELKDIAKSEPLYIHVMTDNPNFHRLVRCYAKMGAKPIAFVMEVTNGT